MVQSVIQTAFHAGEWSPALNARVDLGKYHAAAALLRNFFVDYRGGASTRPGTKYILQCYKSSTAVRLIPFTASFTVNYVLEFGDQYIRFFFNGSPVLETAKTITGATKANPAVITSVGHGLSSGDWNFIAGVGGMTQLNGKYFSITVLTVDTYSLQDLNGANIDSTAYDTYTAGGTASRVYTLPSPYVAADLFEIKFAQNVSTLVICHPDYVPYILTLVAADNWTLTPIPFGTTVTIPTGVAVATTLGAGSVHYSYIVTAFDINNQESVSSAAGTLASKLDITTNPGTNTITWNAVTGAQGYNIYRATRSYAGAIPAGVAHGYIGTATGTSFIDTNIEADFAFTPPIARNPFQGASVVSIAVTAAGTYTTVPSVVLDNAPSGGVTATANAILQATVATAPAGSSGVGYVVGDSVLFANGVVLLVATLASLVGDIATYTILNPGSITGGTTPANPVLNIGTSGSGSGAEATLTWGVGIVQVISGGAGYTSTPAVTFSAGAAAATATLGPASTGNPAVPTYFQQRLVFAGPNGNPQQFNMSQPGAYFNYNVSDPVQPDDAIQGTIVSSQLNEIQSLIPMPSGLIVLGTRSAWQINGGAAGAPVTAIDAQAQAQAYNGASGNTPLVVNYDILYVQAKGSIVRDLSYNFYTNIYTGTDISILSSQLFYGFTIVDWTYAEEPFKVVWAVRDDGTLLSLTYVKEQEMVGWAHSDTSGDFKSVCSVTEEVSFGFVDAVYVVVEREINGNTVKYIERFAERLFDGLDTPWCVDCGLQYDGAPTTTFSGAEHLAGETVTGLADGEVITPFVMAVDGSFTLPEAASVVTVGIAFLPQLQTLQLDLGEPTVQGKRKKISAVTVRCQDTLGLSIGKSFTTLVSMKDLVVGNVGSQTNQVVTGLVTGDARTLIDPSFDVPGQYCIQQSYPYPATILGVIPEVVIGDGR